MYVCVCVIYTYSAQLVQQCMQVGRQSAWYWRKNQRGGCKRPRLLQTTASACRSPQVRGKSEAGGWEEARVQAAQQINTQARKRPNTNTAEAKSVTSFGTLQAQRYDLNCSWSEFQGPPKLKVSCYGQWWIKWTKFASTINMAIYLFIYFWENKKKKELLSVDLRDVA